MGLGIFEAGGNEFKELENGFFMLIGLEIEES